MLTTDQKKARAALLIRGKADFRIRKITTDKEEPYIIIQWSLYLSKKIQQALICMHQTAEHQKCDTKLIEQ